MSSTKTCLVTVPIPEVRENNCFVLGEWCKLFKDRESWEKISHSMHEYHWEDPNKIEKDHDLNKYKWQKPHQPNLTGTEDAYYPNKNKDGIKKKYSSWKE